MSLSRIFFSFIFCTTALFWVIARPDNETSQEEPIQNQDVNKTSQKCFDEQTMIEECYLPFMEEIEDNESAYNGTCPLSSILTIKMMKCTDELSQQWCVDVDPKVTWKKLESTLNYGIVERCKEAQLSKDGDPTCTKIFSTMECVGTMIRDCDTEFQNFVWNKANINLDEPLPTLSQCEVLLHYFKKMNSK
ncbi:hypothetical protein DdX_18470 [Ditylenchus destructor]|uniref:DUF19 domain-containing protein n=1 Tax=Ditylenchus destructor TaxID=166010 RepID=A0AAD4MJV6_9BILA|nr:hypothetical protein DdX_18470 [Ditylenchus destructor]